MPDDVSALELVLTGDPALVAIVQLALLVSLSAAFLAAVIGVPLGAWLALSTFRGRDGVIVLLNARFSLVTALLAGFGRAAAEVGAVIIVGGNIEGFTRTMTTAIALETSKGNLALAIGLGLVLIAIVVIVNALAWALQRAAERL